MRKSRTLEISNEGVVSILADGESRFKETQKIRPTRVRLLSRLGSPIKSSHFHLYLYFELLTLTNG